MPPPEQGLGFCLTVGLPTPTLPTLPPDELFQKVAEDYVHFTAFQVMTGERAGSVPPQAPSPMSRDARAPREGAEDERCGVWQGPSSPPPSLGTLRVRAGGCPAELGPRCGIPVLPEARLSSAHPP